MILIESDMHKYWILFLLMIVVKQNYCQNLELKLETEKETYYTHEKIFYYYQVTNIDGKDLIINQINLGTLAKLVILDASGRQFEPYFKTDLSIVKKPSGIKIEPGTTWGGMSFVSLNYANAFFENKLLGGWFLPGDYELYLESNLKNEDGENVKFESNHVNITVEDPPLGTIDYQALKNYLAIDSRFGKEYKKSLFGLIEKFENSSYYQTFLFKYIKLMRILEPEETYMNVKKYFGNVKSNYYGLYLLSKLGINKIIEKDSLLKQASSDQKDKIIHILKKNELLSEAYKKLK